MAVRFLPTCIVVLLAGLLVSNLLIPATARALTASEQVRLQAIHATVQYHRGEAIEESREVLVRRTTDQPILTERTQVRFQTIGSNLHDRLVNTHAHLEQIAARLDQRIALEASAGYETADALFALTVAKTALAATSDILAEIDTDLQHFISSHDPGHSWRQLRTVYEITEQNLRDAQRALYISIRALQDAQRRVSSEASPLRE